MSIITINKSILRLAIPNIVTNITVPLLGLVDLALMGHLQDPVYIGAIALGSIIFNVIYSGFGFLRMGTVGMVAQAHGSNQYNEIVDLVFRNITFVIVISLLLIFLQF